MCMSIYMLDRRDLQRQKYVWEIIQEYMRSSETLIGFSVLVVDEDRRLTERKRRCVMVFIVVRGLKP